VVVPDVLVPDVPDPDVFDGSLLSGESVRFLSTGRSGSSEPSEVPVAPGSA
jgi:hypothetical protein